MTCSWLTKIDTDSSEDTTNGERSIFFSLVAGVNCFYWWFVSQDNGVLFPKHGRKTIFQSLFFPPDQTFKSQANSQSCHGAGNQADNAFADEGQECGDSEKNHDIGNESMTNQPGFEPGREFVDSGN